MRRLFLFIFCFVHALAFCKENLNDHLPIYRKIKDIFHPTLDDYRLIQNYLKNGKRPKLERTKDYQLNARYFRIIGDIPEQYPQSGLIAVNCRPNEKENCLVLYSSFNQNFPRGLKRLIATIKDSDFKGHILYRLGGWPHVEKGALVLAHIPYAFKVCMFKEAQHLGFKRIFWMDSAFLPLVSLNLIFEMIAEKGYFVMDNYHTVGPFCNEEAAAAFGLTLEQTHEIPSCSGGLFGLDLTQPIGAKILSRWYSITQHKDASFSSRNEQNVLSLVLHQAGIKDFTNFNTMPSQKNQVKLDSLFFHDWGYVHSFDR